MGEVLLILMGQEPPKPLLDRLKASNPDVEVRFHNIGGVTGTKAYFTHNPDVPKGMCYNYFPLTFYRNIRGCYSPIHSAHCAKTRMGTKVKADSSYIGRH
jgi:hypothetical protein